MNIYTVFVWDSYSVSDDKKSDSFWFRLENAQARVKELNDKANEDGETGLWFVIEENTVQDMPEGF